MLRGSALEQTLFRLNLRPLLTPLELHPDGGLEVVSSALPVFEAVILSKRQIHPHVSSKGQSACFGTTSPKCSKSTRDYNSQNSSCQQPTQLPACSVLGNYERAPFFLKLQVWFYSLLQLAPSSVSTTVLAGSSML